MWEIAEQERCDVVGLPPTTHRWITDQLGGMPVWSMSGGTDICSGFAGGSSITPVHAGELSVRNLGVPMEAWGADGNPGTDEVGNLFVTRPMPSMPVAFWNDPDHVRYLAFYFDMYPDSGATATGSR